MRTFTYVHAKLLNLFIMKVASACALYRTKYIINIVVMLCMYLITLLHVLGRMLPEKDPLSHGIKPGTVHRYMLNTISLGPGGSI